MLKAMFVRSIRKDRQRLLLVEVDRKMQKYAALHGWLNREIQRYKAEEAFESLAIIDCAWVLQCRAVGDEVVLAGQAHQAILGYFPNTYYGKLEYGGLGLILSDNDLTLYGPSEVMSKYIADHKIVFDIGNLNATIDKRSVELLRLTNLRDILKEYAK